MLRADHIVPHVYGEASGTKYAVLRICNSIANLGVETHLHVLQPTDVQGYEVNFDVHAYPAKSMLAPLGRSPAMKRGLVKVAQASNIMHNHGMWMMPNVYPGQAVRGTDCRMITAPHGTLTEWTLRKSYWKKKTFWNLCQKQALDQTACFHATAIEEMEDIRRCGFKQPVALIPNGIDIPAAVERNRDLLEKRQLLFISRINPKKGVDILLKAWAMLQSKFPDWELLVVGPDHHGSIAEMQQLGKELGVERVSFPGPVYGEEKAEVYRNADIYVLPTHSENFGLTIGEALSHGVPAITTKGAPWEGLIKNECGWWIDIGVEPLHQCLNEALSAYREELDVLGQRGQEWMKRDFSWEVIGEMLEKTYDWLSGGGQEPSWIEAG